MFFYLYHRIYGLTRYWRPKRRPKQHANYPFRRRPPRNPNRKASPGRTYVNICIWIPRLLMVLPAIQSPRRPTWTNRRVRNPKFFFLPGVDWCITTINSSLTRRRVPKSLLPFFCPTKPPNSELTNPCMASMQDSPSAPHQIKFDTDSQKFLIDSGASAHLWNRRKDFIYYRSLSPQERKNNQVLGVSGEAVAPQGIGSIRLRIEDDLNDIHTIHLPNRRLYQELWSALTNFNPLFRASYPLQYGNLWSESIEVCRCSWTTQVTSRTSTCTNTSQRTKQSTRNTRSSA